ncbi:MAG: sodium-independent anion transporter, partial [Patescibacteria group bacterium]|nr:sodium-independent anion transporter [Patescibacteria group bacterium]
MCLAPDPAHPNRKFTASCSLPKCLQLAIIRIDGAIFFGSVDNIEHELRNLKKQYPGQKNLLIVFSGVSSIDLAGIDMLIGQMKIYRDKGGDLYISNVNKPVYEKLRKYGLVDALGENNIFNSKPDAIKYIVEKLDAGKCKECPHKIFYECDGKIR